MKNAVCIPIILLYNLCSIRAQETTSLPEKLLSLPDKVFNTIGEKTNRFEQNLLKGTEKYLSKLERQEKKLYKKLYRKDSLKAKELFGDIDSRYESLKEELNRPLTSFTSLSNNYNSRLDSLNTTFDFMQQHKLVNAPNNPLLSSSLKNFRCCRVS